MKNIKETKYRISLEEGLFLEVNIRNKKPATPTVVSTSTNTYTAWSRTLKFGSIGSDVKDLQVFLNMCADTKVASSGAGSPGRETIFFGPKTKAAVMRWQAARGVTPVDGVFGPASHAKAAELQASSNVCGGGVIVQTAPLPISQFLDIGVYTITFHLLGWLLKHIIKDVDDALWKKIKESVRSIFTSSDNNSKVDDHVPFIVSGYPEYKDVVFIFEKRMTLEDFENSFSQIELVLKKLDLDSLKETPHFPLIFEFNIKDKNWENWTQKYYPWFK